MSACPRCKNPLHSCVCGTEVDEECRSMAETVHAEMINQWHLNDKAILAQALKDIYAIRGEDAEIAAIVLKALREGCVPGHG